jgi:hypothetical protein
MAAMTGLPLPSHVGAGAAGGGATGTGVGDGAGAGASVGSGGGGAVVVVVVLVDVVVVVDDVVEVDERRGVDESGCAATSEGDWSRPSNTSADVDTTATATTINPPSIQRFRSSRPTWSGSASRAPRLRSCGQPFLGSSR